MFFIVWGKKLVRKRTGTVGHFCPICRESSVFRVDDLRRANHVYFFAVDSGEAVATELRCQECDVLLGFEPECIETSPQFADESIDAYAMRTSPIGEERVRERLSLEKALADRRLSPEGRLVLLHEPFDALDYAAAVELDRGNHQSLSAVLVVLTGIGMFASTLLWHSVFDPVNRNNTSVRAAAVIVTGLTVALLAWVVYRVVTQSGRVGRSRAVFRPLVRSLRPLSPRREELEQVLAAHREAKTSIGNCVNAPALAVGIDRS